jgi:hypothetical protein
MVCWCLRSTPISTILFPQMMQSIESGGTAEAGMLHSVD